MAALRARQRGFLLNPFRFGGGAGPATDPFFSSTVLNCHFDTDSSWTDNSASPKTLTATGTIGCVSSPAKFGNSLSVNSSQSNYLSVAASSQFICAGEFTWEYWIYSNFSSQIFVVQQASHWALLVNTAGAPSIAWGGSQRLLLSDLTVADNTWTHVAFCRDSSNVITGYVGGVKSADTATVSGNAGGNVTLRIGNSNVIGSTQKYIDDLRLTRGVARYNASFTPPSAPFPDS